MVAKVRSPVHHEKVCILLLFVFAVVIFPLERVVRGWMWLGYELRCLCVAVPQREFSRGSPGLSVSGKP